MLFDGWKFEGNSHGTKLIDIWSLDGTDDGQVNLEQTHLTSPWPQRIPKHGTVLSLSRRRVRVESYGKVLPMLLHVRAENKVHRSRIPSRHKSVSAGEMLRCWKARRHSTSGLSTTCSQQIFYHRHKAVNRPDRLLRLHVVLGMHGVLGVKRRGKQLVRENRLAS
jgi:hypothetical protein